jgi:hypothetical protein
LACWWFALFGQDPSPQQLTFWHWTTTAPSPRRAISNPPVGNLDARFLTCKLGQEPPARRSSKRMQQLAVLVEGAASTEACYCYFNKLLLVQVVHRRKPPLTTAQERVAASAAPGKLYACAQTGAKGAETCDRGGHQSPRRISLYYFSCRLEDGWATGTI